MASDIRLIGDGPYRVLPDPDQAASLLSGSGGGLVQLELQDPTASKYVWVNPANVVSIIGVPQRP